MINLNLFDENKNTDKNISPKRCSLCGKPYIKNTLLPENMIKILGEKIKYIPSCKCHETFYERKIAELSSQYDRERILNRGGKYKNFSLMDSKFLNSKFENADTTENLSLCRKYAEFFITKEVHTGLILFGNSGTGKTFDSSCVANYLMERGKSVMALNLGLYLSRLKLEWSSIEIQVLKRVSECDLLIIDDFGAEKVTDWMLEKVFLLIDTRYKSEKPLIITTNLEFKKNSKCEIEKFFGKRIKDRICEMCCPLLYSGESRRKTADKSFWEAVM